MIWDNMPWLAILAATVLAVIVGVQISGIWNCC